MQTEKCKRVGRYSDEGAEILDKTFGNVQLRRGSLKIKPYFELSFKGAFKKNLFSFGAFAPKTAYFTYVITLTFLVREYRLFLIFGTENCLLLTFVQFCIISIIILNFDT